MEELFKDFKVSVEDVPDGKGGVRRAKFASCTLPSGLAVKFRVPGPYGWTAIWGHIPALSKPKPGEADPKPDKSEGFAIMQKALRLMVEFCVDPKVAEAAPSEVAAGTLSSWEIDEDDVLEFLNAVVKAMGYGTDKAKAAEEIASQA